MTAETDRTRSAAFEIAKKAGWQLSRIGTGQRYVVEMRNGGRTVNALVKAASRGGAMARADVDDADGAVLSGFWDDVDHVLFAVAGSAEYYAYLVPISEAEEAYRAGHRAWRATHPTNPPNTTWLVHFEDRGDPENNGYHKKWAKYRVGTTGATTEDVREPLPTASPGLSIEEAKSGLALRFGVAIERVKIVIEY